MRRRLIVFLAILPGVLPPPAGAQSAREPRIDIVKVDTAWPSEISGLTVNPVEVTYTIEFVPANATHAEIQYLRDGEVIRSFPAPLKAGSNSVTLPEGLPMEYPTGFLSVRAELPSGIMSELSGLTIYAAALFAERDLLARARFLRLSPDLVTPKASPQIIRIIGTDLGPHTSLTVDGIDVDTTHTHGALQLEIPPDALRFFGFVEVNRAGISLAPRRIRGNV